MTRSLEDRVAVVTGAGSGIGRGIARRLAEDKAAVAVWDLNLDGAAETVKMITEMGGKAIALGVDCSDKAAIRAAAEQTRSALGTITILVNNAGISPAMPFLDLGDDLFDTTIPVKRLGQPEDIAAAVAFLASEEASYMTGQTISTNGGRYMGSA